MPLTSLPVAQVTADSRRDFGLDLARFAAIALVLAAHCSAMFLAVPAGWGTMLESTFGIVGVDLFFVLSGLLIGRLLFDIAESGPSLRGWRIFMTRRWLRTLPLYWLWLAVLLLVLPGNPGWTLLRFATLTQNLAWPMPHGLWFMVSWSLTVEEWFYLLFSAAYLGLAALFGARRAAWPVILLFILAPAIARHMLPPTSDYMRDVMTVAYLRLDAIAYGVALARLSRDGIRLLRRKWLMLALGLGVPGFFWVQDVGGLWFGLPVAPLTYLNVERPATSLGMALLLAAALGLRPVWWPVRRVVEFGSRISYGVYLMHMTVIEVLLRFAALHGIGLFWVFSASAALIVVLPYLSWRFYEAPILALRPSQGRGASVVRAATLPALTVAAEGP